MRLRPGILLISLAASLLLSGCNTIAVRVLTHFGLFAKLDAHVRKQVLRGQVEIGYTQAGVILAFGRPNYSSSAALKGGYDVWSYSGFDVTSHASFTLHHPEYAYSTPTRFLGSVTFRDGQVIEYTNRFAAR